MAEVIVCGASGSGKTTIVNMVRLSALNRTGAIRIPRRFITRPRRQNDDFEENTHLSHREFDAFQSEMSLTWTRRFSARRVERYGFANLDDALVLIYSANTALVEERQNDQARRVTSDALILGVSAPPRVRYARFASHNPALIDNTEEMQHRFGNGEVDIAKWSHVVLDTERATLRELESEVLAFFTRVLGARREALGL